MIKSCLYYRKAQQPFACMKDHNNEYTHEVNVKPGIPSEHPWNTFETSRNIPGTLKIEGSGRTNPKTSEDQQRFLTSSENVYRSPYERLMNASGMLQINKKS